jgi:hypothetical protein
LSTRSFNHRRARPFVHNHSLPANPGNLPVLALDVVDDLRLVDDRRVIHDDGVVAMAIAKATVFHKDKGRRCHHHTARTQRRPAAIAAAKTPRNP